jgi:hypothetical protein
MYTSLEEIIKSLLVQVDAPGEHNYLRLFELARQGLKELSFDTTRHIKTSLLTVNTNTNTVTLPSDYVNLVKLGAYGTDGMIHYLVERDDLYIGSTTPTSSVDIANTADSLPVFNETVGTGRQFGKGGGQSSIGYYRVNKKSGTIEFASPIKASQIVLEYITDGIDNLDIKQNVLIHSFASTALKAFVYWNHIKYNRDVQSYDKQAAKKEFYNEKRLARARMQNFTKDQALVQSRINVKQSPKI